MKKKTRTVLLLVKQLADCWEQLFHTNMTAPQMFCLKFPERLKNCQIVNVDNFIGK